MGLHIAVLYRQFKSVFVFFIVNCRTGIYALETSGCVELETEETSTAGSSSRAGGGDVWSGLAAKASGITRLEATSLGKIASYYYLTHETLRCVCLRVDMCVCVLCLCLCA